MKQLKHILLNIDEVDDPSTAFDLALSFAEFQQAKLRLLTVLPSFKDLFAFFEEKSKRKELQLELERQCLSGLANLAENVRTLEVSYGLEKGSKAESIVSTVLTEQCDFLIKDVSPDPLQAGDGLGSIDRKLARHCPCPVWFVRSKNPQPDVRSIYVAINAGADEPLEKELNRRLIDYGLLLAKYKKLPLEVIYVWDFDREGVLHGSLERIKYTEALTAAEARAEEQLSKLLGQMNLNLSEEHVHLLKGTPSSIIVKYCKKHPVDTLVIGSVGRSGISGLLIGNTAERVISNIDCSVLIISPKELKSPLEQSFWESLQMACSANTN